MLAASKGNTFFNVAAEKEPEATGAGLLGAGFVLGFVVGFVAGLLGAGLVLGFVAGFVAGLTASCDKNLLAAHPVPNEPRTFFQVYK